MREKPTLEAATDLPQLLDKVVKEALEIGSNNWDSYLAGNRWPTIQESPNYQELKRRLEGD